MNNRQSQRSILPDPAAVFGAASSLWDACQAEEERNPQINLSDAYNGRDELMREVMRIGLLFEEWACIHVAFDEAEQVWPYHLKDSFGAACLKRYGPESMAQFFGNDCLLVAMELKLPVFVSDGLSIPVDVRVANPSPHSEFRAYRIQSMRREVDEDREVTAFRSGDDPEDEGYEDPFFSLHGVGENGLAEWIADRPTCAEAIRLLKNLVPDIKLPPEPWVVRLEPMG
ncbi:MAG: hypothetical protein QM755_01225 [Luteolibacter sp.]